MGAFVHVGPPGIRQWFTTGLFAWGVLWAAIPFGVAWLTEHRRRFAVIAAISALESLVATRLFSDTARMLLPMFPIVVVAVARVVEVARRRLASLAVFGVAALSMPLLLDPNELVAEASVLRTSAVPRAVAVVVGWVAVASVVPSRPR